MNLNNVLAKASLTALGGAGKAALALYLAGVMSYSYIVAVFLVLLAVYLADRIEDLTDGKEGRAWAAAALCAAGALALAHEAGGLAGVGLPLAIGLVYRWTFKLIPGGKNLAVACCWAWCCSGWAVTQAAGVELLVYFFGLQLVDTIYCDMRDMDADRKKGIVTVPMVLGARTPAALMLACVALAVWAAWTLPASALLLLGGVAWVVFWHSDFRRLEVIERDLDIAGAGLLVFMVIAPA